jgi:hypothetical protein
MRYFNPSRRVSHKAIVVVLYLLFFAVQWALRYAFPPEQNRQQATITLSDKKVCSFVADDQDDRQPSNLRLNKRYFPVTLMAVSQPAIPTPVYFHIDTHRCIDPGEIFMNSFIAATGKRGPPFS